MIEAKTQPSPLPDDVVALVPMRNVVLFPHLLMPITVGRPKSVAAIEHALTHKTVLAISLQKDPKEDDPGLDGLCSIGTLASIVQHRAGEDGQIHAVCQGLQRVRILALQSEQGFLAVRIERIEEPSSPTTESQALALQLQRDGAEAFVKS